MTLPNLTISDSGSQPPAQNLNPETLQSNQSQSQTQQTLNSPSQTGPAFDQNAVLNELAQLRQQNQAMFQMMLQGGMAGNNQQRQVQQTQPTVPEVPEITKDEFWENPAKSTRALVETLMQRQLAPVNQGIQYFMAQQQYANAKLTMKNMPQYNALVKFEDIFDQVVGQAINSGIPLTDGLLTTSYYTAYGIAANQGRFNQQQVINNPGQAPVSNSNPMVLNGNTNQPIQQNQPNNIVTPPYLATNNNNNPNIQTANVRLRQLDENEETIRKYNRMSPAEFLFYGQEIDFNTFKAADPQGAERYEKIGGKK